MPWQGERSGQASLRGTQGASSAAVGLGCLHGLRGLPLAWTRV